MTDYRKIKAWRRARALSRRVFLLIGKLPLEERIRRADHISKTTTQIRAAIVEGSGNESPLEFARFLGYAIRSADELGDELQELADIDLLPPEDRDLPDECHQIAAMTVAFRKAVLRTHRSVRRNSRLPNKKRGA
jgi:four helix bundle protein